MLKKLEQTDFVRFLWRNARIIAAGAAGVVVMAAAISMISGWISAAPDFREFEAGAERKSEFLSYMRPLIEAQNRELLEDRERLQELADDEGIGWLDRRWLHGLAADYGVPVTGGDGEALADAALIDALLLRVDAVPESLALAQAAKESGWGTSRFAREGNNFYGQWCFKAGCGIVPGSRTEGRTHEVEAFESPAESVASYMRNINTHSGYKVFRQARKRQRESKQQLSGVDLAKQLSQYSERRDAYVREVRNLIINNDLEQTASAETAADNVGGS